MERNLAKIVLELVARKISIFGQSASTPSSTTPELLLVGVLVATKMIAQPYFQNTELPVAA